jgi:hypothetical protein
MTNKKFIKLTVAGVAIAVIAVGVGIGVGVSDKNKKKTELAANMLECRRVLVVPGTEHVVVDAPSIRHKLSARKLGVTNGITDSLVGTSTTSTMWSGDAWTTTTTTTTSSTSVSLVGTWETGANINTAVSASKGSSKGSLQPVRCYHISVLIINTLVFSKYIAMNCFACAQHRIFATIQVTTNVILICPPLVAARVARVFNPKAARVFLGT